MNTATLERTSMSFHGPPARRTRRSILFMSCLGLLVLLILLHHRSQYLHPFFWERDSSLRPIGDPLLEDRVHFWRSLNQIILDNRPRCKNPPEIVVPKDLDIAYENDHDHDRPDILWLEKNDAEVLRKAHESFTTAIRKAQIHLVYRKGTRGIITTVSDSLIPILLIQVRMLRLTGSSLPVEVFLSRTTPYNDHICTHILSPLDAKCVFLSNIFTAAGQDIDISGYQYKIFAILFSSFDEVLMLDGDAWPVTSPDHLFTYPPFTTTGMVLWPDFWYASESPYYFTIAGIKKPPTLRERPATEAGELMYAKRKHEASILLAAYYNYYGPEYYYPLLSQGAPGQGDKETFGAAALASQERFYAVKTIVTAIGRRDSSGHFLGTAMLQYDPIVDLQEHGSISALSRRRSSILTERNEMHDNGQTQQRRPQQAVSVEQTGKPMFIHANFPKFDPRSIFDEHEIGAIRASPTRDSNGTWVRCWDLAHEAASDRFEYDVEKRFWEVIETVACDDLLDKSTATIQRNSKELYTCSKVTQYVQHVFDAGSDGQYINTG